MDKKLRVEMSKIERANGELETVPLLRGVFEAVTSHGLPLDYAVEYASSRSALVDWSDFVRDALNAGWSELQIATRVQEARSMVESLSRVRGIGDHRA